MPVVSWAFSTHRRGRGRRQRDGRPRLVVGGFGSALFLDDHRLEGVVLDDGQLEGESLEAHSVCPPCRFLGASCQPSVSVLATAAGARASSVRS
jgi:hypothetical protein